LGSVQISREERKEAVDVTYPDVKILAGYTVAF